jgi:hypothetical protein
MQLQRRRGLFMPGDIFAFFQIIMTVYQTIQTESSQKKILSST